MHFLKTFFTDPFFNILYGFDIAFWKSVIHVGTDWLDEDVDEVVVDDHVVVDDEVFVHVEVDELDHVVVLVDDDPVLDVLDTLTKASLLKLEGPQTLSTQFPMFQASGYLRVCDKETLLYTFISIFI